MPEESKDITPDYEKKIAESSDHEILKILELRKQYQRAAADFAVQEAIRRGLIHSEQDLFHQKFNGEPPKFWLFPTIEKETDRQRIRKSIGRSLLIAGFLPLVWGALQIYQDNFLMGAAIFILSGVWVFSAFHLISNSAPTMLKIMFLLWLAAVVYLALLLIDKPDLVFMDIFIASSVCALGLYGLLFLRKLG